MAIYDIKIYIYEDPYYKVMKYLKHNFSFCLCAHYLLCFSFLINTEQRRKTIFLSQYSVKVCPVYIVYIRKTNGNFLFLRFFFTVKILESQLCFVNYSFSLSIYIYYTFSILSMFSIFVDNVAFLWFCFFFFFLFWNIYVIR